jgi:hypothetical protein
MNSLCETEEHDDHHWRFERCTYVANYLRTHCNLIASNTVTNHLASVILNQDVPPQREKMTLSRLMLSFNV